MGLKNKKLRKICIEAGLIGFIQDLFRIRYRESSSSLGTGQSCLSNHLEIAHPIPGSHMSGGSSPDVALEAHPLLGDWECHKGNSF